MTKAQVKAVTEFIKMFEKVHIEQNEGFVIRKLEVSTNTGTCCDVTLFIQAGLPDAPQSECITSIIGIGYDGYVVGYNKKFIKLEGLFDNLFQ